MNFFGKSSAPFELINDNSEDSTNAYRNVFALDQLKQSGLPIKSQILPYLQVLFKKIFY